MKKFTSQILALVLAFCMVAALVPAVPANAADGDIVLNFAIASAANTSLAGLDTSAGGWTWNQEETGSYIVDQITKGQSLKNWWSNGPTGQRVSFFNSQITSQKMGFDFYAPSAGWYEISEKDIQALTVNNNTATGEIHVISGGEVSRAASFSAMISSEIDQLAELGSFTTEKVYLRAGINTIVFKGTAIRNTSHTMLFVKKVVFSKTNTPEYKEPENVTLDFTPATFNTVVGDEAGIDHITDYVAWNWKYNAELTTAGQESTIPWASGNGSGTSGVDKGYDKLRKAMGCFYIKLNSELGGIALDFYVDTDGWYKINSDGIVAGGVGAADSGITNVYAGTIDDIELVASVDASGDQAVIAPKGVVFLQRGENILILRGAKNGTYGNMLKLSRITFVPADDSEIPTEKSEPYVQTIDTSSDKVLTQNSTDAIYALDGWEINKDITPAGMYAYLLDPDGSKLPRFFKMYGTGNSANNVPVGHASTYFNWGGDENDTFSIDFYNDVEGVYDISAVTVEYPASTVEGDILINGKVAGKITCDATGEAYVAIEKTLVEQVELSKGRNTLTIVKTGGGNGFNLSKLTLIPYVEPQYEPGDVNGDGKLNTRDVTTLRRYLAGGYEDSITYVAEMIDVNGDGRENTRDVAALRALIAG